MTVTQDAVTLLNTLQSNFQVVDAIRKSGQRMNQDAIPEMIEWVSQNWIHGMRQSTLLCSALTL